MIWTVLPAKTSPCPVAGTGASIAIDAIDAIALANHLLRRSTCCPWSRSSRVERSPDSATCTGVVGACCYDGRLAGAQIGAAVDGAAHHLAHLRIRQKQIVVDEAPALLGGVDHAQPQSLELRFFGRADAGDAAGELARQSERAVVGRRDDGDLAGERAETLDRRREDVDVDIR